MSAQKADPGVEMSPVIPAGNQTHNLSITSPALYQGSLPTPSLRHKRTVSQEDACTDLRPHAGVPAAVVAGPQVDASQAGHGEQDVGVDVGCVQRVGELLHLAVGE